MDELVSEISNAIIRLSDKDKLNHEICCKAAAEAAIKLLEKNGRVIDVFPLITQWSGDDKTGYTGWFMRFPQIIAEGKNLPELMDNLSIGLDHAMGYNREHLDNTQNNLQIIRLWVKKISEMKLIKDETVLLTILASLRTEAKALLENKRV